MGLRQLTGRYCFRCGQRVNERAPGCPDCGELGLLQYAYDLKDVARSLDRAALERREPWMWRYKELLPLDELAETPGLQVGMTPIFGAPRLAAWAGVAGLWLKDEGRNPSGSIEDRASAVVVVEAREAGRRVVAVASHAAAGPSLACFAANMARRAVLFAPEDSALQDLARAAGFGALVLRVAGPLASAQELCAQACQKLRWFDRTSATSLLPFQGKKTVGHEIAEQLGERMPDWVVVPTDADAGGETLAALACGLDELRALGLIKVTPRLLGVERCAAPGALTAALSRRGEDPQWLRAGEALRSHDGAALAVDEQIVVEATSETARRGAVMPDADGAAAVAGLKRAVEEGIIEPGQTALVLISGRGQHPGTPAQYIEVGRELARVEQAVQQAGLGN
ncbi:MAG: pyridoxal-phosphate dependent enzyme [Deltaproteobacteria bacterium]|nr:pyridoxal-phosphate dependent enzyme [Deltaproteobacteria bacterium]